MSDIDKLSKPVGNAAAPAMTLDEAIAHAEDVADRCDTSCGREHRQLADWLKELRDMKSRNVGNSAAMREALITIRQQLQTLDEYGNIAKEAYLTILGWIDAALSEPARNCDFYDNKTDAETRFVEETGENDTSQHYWQMFAIWLFALAAERKGSNR